MKSNVFKLLKVFILTLSIFSCGVNKKEKSDKLYKETSYTKLEDNKDASMEVLNQINFIKNQLERKENGKPYEATSVVGNIVILSGISSEITGIGFLGNTYELNQKTVSKWDDWYKENKDNIFYETIDGIKHIVVNYSNGKKVILKEN